MPRLARFQFHILSNTFRSSGSLVRRRSLQLADYESARNHVVQSLLLLREARHDVPDSYRKKGNVASEIPACRAAESNTRSCQVSDFKSECFLPESCLPRRALQKCIVKPFEHENYQENSPHACKQREKIFW